MHASAAAKHVKHAFCHDGGLGCSVSDCAACLAGHSDPRWLQTVTEQAATLAHTSNLFHTVPQARLCHSDGCCCACCGGVLQHVGGESSLCSMQVLGGHACGGAWAGSRAALLLIAWA